MDDEYYRLLYHCSPTDYFDCNRGYVDAYDCSWYHHNWMLLRYLGLVSNPFWHSDFYQYAVEKFAKQNCSVLVIGTADFSMPMLLQQSGLRNIVISDICNTPLKICKNVSDYHKFSWKTKRIDIFDGIQGSYDLIINDAFLTRFPYSQKKTVIERIYDGLSSSGFYITTFRHGWNNGNPIIANATDKINFISRSISAAKRMGVDPANAKKAATDYIDRMLSYPIKDTMMLEELIDGLFVIEKLEIGLVSGECSQTEYYRVVLRKKL